MNRPCDEPTVLNRPVMKRPVMNQPATVILFSFNKISLQCLHISKFQEWIRDLLKGQTMMSTKRHPGAEPVVGEPGL